MPNEHQEITEMASLTEEHRLFILEERVLKPNILGIHRAQVWAGETWLIFRDGIFFKRLEPGPHIWWHGFFHTWRVLRINLRTMTLDLTVEGRVKGIPVQQTATQPAEAYDVEANLTLTCRISDVEKFLSYRDPISVLLASIRNMVSETMSLLPYDQYGQWAIRLRDHVREGLQYGDRDASERLTGIQVEDIYVTSIKPNILRERDIIHASPAGSERSKETISNIIESTLATEASSSDSDHDDDNHKSSHGLSVLQIRIVEDPLTVQNVVLILSALMELYTKCWLIKQDRLDDLIEFTHSHTPRFSEEANLTILKMTRNSPADIKFNVNADVSAQGLAEALKAGIDAVTLAPLRHEEAKLLNQAKVLDNRLKEQEAQSALVEKEQIRHIEAQKAEIEAQKALLEIEKQKIELAKQQLALQQERLQLEIATRDFAFETAEMMIEKLYPDADTKTKAILARTLVPNLLQLGSAKGLIALPESKNTEHEAIDIENG